MQKWARTKFFLNTNLKIYISPNKYMGMDLYQEHKLTTKIQVTGSTSAFFLITFKNELL